MSSWKWDKSPPLRLRNDLLNNSLVFRSGKSSTMRMASFSTNSDLNATSYACALTSASSIPAIAESTELCITFLMHSRMPLMHARKAISSGSAKHRPCFAVRPNLQHHRSPMPLSRRDTARDDGWPQIFSLDLCLQTPHNHHKVRQHEIPQIYQFFRQVSGLHGQFLRRLPT